MKATFNQLQTAALKYLELIRHGEFWELLISTLLMLFVGQHLIGNHVRLQRFAFIGGVIAFFAVIVAEFAETGFPLSDTLPGLLFQALLGGVFSFSLGTLVIPVAAICWNCSMRTLIQSYQGRRESRAIAEATRRRKLRDDEEMIRQRHQQAAVNEHRRGQETEAREQQLREQQQQESDDRRRQIARFECQLLFDQHHTELFDLFPDNFLEGHFQRYMGDSVTPELVEQRGKALQSMFRERLRRSGSSEARQFESIGELVRWFDQKREEISASFTDATDPGAAHIIDTLNTQILQQRDQAIREFLK